MDEFMSMELDAGLLKEFPFIARFDSCMLNALCNKVLSTIYLEKKLGKCKGMNFAEKGEWNEKKISEIFMEYKDKDIEQVGLGFPGVYSV